MAMETATLDVADIVTLVIYFFIVMAVGIFATFKINRGSASGFFLAGRSMTWLPIAGSLFATNMGAPLMVGLPGSGAATGIAPVMFEWHTYTMPEYLHRRYGGKRLQLYYAIKDVVLSIIVGVSVELMAASIFINQILGWNIYISTLFLLLITAVYTIGGGLAAVIWTDTLQSAILIIGTTVLSIIAMDQIGGYEAMMDQFPKAAAEVSYLEEALYENRSCGFPPADYDHIFRGMDSAYPWPGLTIGVTIQASGFFCTSQIMVQRTLAAKTVSHGKAACVMASYLKLLPFFLFLWPGMISRILYPDEVACSDPETCFKICENRNGCTDIAFPLLVLRIMPAGLRGLMLAALLAASMSTLTSQFNATASMFTLDIWKHIRPRAGDREIVIVGRVCTVVMVLLSFAWLPGLMQIRGSNIWDYLQSVMSYTSPPWVVVFFLGVFWKRTTEQGAWWGLMAGLVVGICRMGVHFAYRTPQCGDGLPDTRPAVLTEMHYLHFAILLTGITFIVQVAVSVMTQPRSPKQLRRVTWWTRHDTDEPELTDYEEDSDYENKLTDKLVTPSTDKPKRFHKFYTELKDNDEDSEYENLLADEMNDPPTGRSETSCTRKAYNILCGFNNSPAPRLSKEEMDAARRKLTNIGEDPFWSRVCDINAVIVVAIASFVIGFYA